MQILLWKLLYTIRNSNNEFALLWFSQARRSHFIKLYKDRVGITAKL